MRRTEFATVLLAALSSMAMAPGVATAAAPVMEFGLLERRTGGRLGVYAVDTGNSLTIAYRSSERFAMCSTFKLPTVAGVLSRVDRGLESLDRRVSLRKADLLDYAPEAKKHVERGWMSVADLCAAAIEYSDNTAANLLLRTLGGPEGFNRYVRSLGDSVTTLNRMEPALNTAIPGDRRDTTTPAAMADDMRKVLLGDALSRRSQRRLSAWLRDCRTGLTCLRAGLPRQWIAGDKTGSGGATNAAGASSTRNDVAIAWPPGRAPILIAAYLTQSKLGAERRDAALAAVGTIVARTLSKPSSAR